MNIFDVGEAVRCDLGKARDIARNPVDVLEAKINLTLDRCRKDVQHGVGRAAHRDIETHGVFKRRFRSDRARQNALVVVVVVAATQFYDALSRLDKELAAEGVGRERCAIAGERKPERLGEAVHRVRRKHSRAGATRGACIAFDLGELIIADGLIDGIADRINEIDTVVDHALDGLAGLHWSTRYEDDGNVEPHGRHEHAGGDLVAVRDAHECIGAVGVNHVLDAVGDNVSARERVEHPLVPHRNAVVDRDCIEFLRHSPGLANRFGNHVANVFEVHMARNELRVGVRDRDDRFAKIIRAHAGRAPQGACAGHVASMG